jgi:folate-binding protein YgfZ
MHPEWGKFLKNLGARRDDAGTLHFGNPRREQQAAANQNIVADLSHQSLIQASGRDATSFLQGQLTNDISQITENRTQLSAYCNAQGRMLALFRIFLRDQSYVLQLPATLCERIVERLRLYILRAKVDVQTDDRSVSVGLSGPGVTACLSKQIATVPQTNGECHTSNGVTVLRIAGPHPRFQIIADIDAAKKLWSDLAASATSVGASAWAWLDIVAGVPTIYPQTFEAFLPQMANLDLLQGVSFDKGCYSGQEIIARVRYLGKVKQRMYRAHVQDAHIPAPGAPLYAADTRDQPVGTVVDAQLSPTEGYDLLAVIQLARAEAGPVCLADATGPALTIEPLPYALS